MTTSAAERLYFTLLAEMASGNYVAGERFLSYREVMQRWRVSYATASQALDLLRASGMIAVHDRSGHYLAANFRIDACIELSRLNETPGLAPAPQRSAHWRTSIMRGLSGKPLKRIAVVVIMNADIFSELQPFESVLNRSSVTRVMVQAILDSAQRAGVAAFVYEFHSKKTTHEEMLAKVLENDPQGVVVRRVNPYRAAPLANALLKRLIPVVTIMGDCEGTEMVTVNVNNIGCGHEAGKALLEGGHRNVAVVTERPSKAHMRDRANGFISTIRARKGCKVTKVAAAVNPQENGAAIRALLESGATALFAVSEEAFSNLLPNIREAGLRMPEQMGAIVCSSRNDVKNHDKMVDITFLDFAEIGRSAFEVLVDFRAGVTPRKCILINTPVISVGSVPVLKH